MSETPTSLERSKVEEVVLALSDHYEVRLIENADQEINPWQDNKIVVLPYAKIFATATECDVYMRYMQDTEGFTDFQVTHPDGSKWRLRFFNSLTEHYAKPGK